jgi:lysophospholipase L1-like esterase
LKLLAQRLLLLFGALVAALIIAEVATRALFHAPRGTPYVAESPDTIYLNKPNTSGRHHSPAEFDYAFQTNTDGLRLTPPSSPGANSPSLLCIGDSFTFGIGAADAETWPSQLASALSRSSHPAEVLNAGVMGWGLAEYWVWLQLHAPHYQPDVIIVGCHASDWQNAANGLVTLGPDHQLVRHQVVRQDVASLKSMTEWIPFYEPLMTHSALANVLKQAVVRLTKKGSTGGALTPEVSAALLQSHVDTLAPLNKAILRGIQETAEQNGAKLVLAFIHSNEAVTPELTIQPDHERFHGLISIWCQELNIPLIDTTPVIESHLKMNSIHSSSLYFPNDGHLNPSGYQLVARTIADFLIAHPEWLLPASRKR